MEIYRNDQRLVTTAGRLRLVIGLTSLSAMIFGLLVGFALGVNAPTL